MSDKEPDNPLEELQKQLREMMRNPQAMGNLSGFPGSTGFQSESEAGDSGSPTKADPEEDEHAEAIRRILEFNLKPREIRDHLNRYVIKQQEAKKVLSVAICDHYNHVRRCLEDPEFASRDYLKQNILLLGPTGVGKTYLIRHIAKLIGVPFVKADATKFSETGYVGGDVEDLVRDLVKMGNQDTELAQFGIIYIDEIDKIAGAAGEQGARDVSGRGVQINLLKLMEETEVNLFSPTDMMAQMQAMMNMSRGGKEQKRTINTRHILFIVSGAFDKLEDIVKKRVGRTALGFNALDLKEGGNPPDPEAEEDPFFWMRYAETPDFLDYGFEPEFIGRIPVRVACESLKPEDLAAILTSSEDNILRQYRDDFKGYDIDFKISNEAILEIASQAYQERTGARGLMTVFERIFRGFKFELPSTAIKKFEVTPQLIENPAGSLRRLLKENAHLMNEVYISDIRRFAADFEENHGLKLEFDDGAMAVLIEEAGNRELTIRALCEAKFKDFQHGLKIIMRNTGQDAFPISEAAARNPDDELSKWVVASFRDRQDEESDEKSSENPEPSEEG